MMPSDFISLAKNWSDAILRSDPNHDSQKDIKSSLKAKNRRHS